MQLELEYVGIFGLSLILTAYFLNYQKLVKRDSRLYDFLNFFGGLSLFYYALQLGGMAFIVLQVVWTLIALYHLVKRELKALAQKTGKKRAKGGKK